MEELFAIAREDVQLESNLASDLDIDSIDAIDLVVKIKELTGKQVNPEDFKNVRQLNQQLQWFFNQELSLNEQSC